jgi:hypothetical protein
MSREPGEKRARGQAVDVTELDYDLGGEHLGVIASATSVDQPIVPSSRYMRRIAKRGWWRGKPWGPVELLASRDL